MLMEAHRIRIIKEPINFICTLEWGKVDEKRRIKLLKKMIY